MREPNTVPLSDIISMQPGYINDKFQAVVSVETMFDPKSGDKYYKAKLHQPSNPKISIAAKFWGDADISVLDGKLVEFHGQGLQRTEYKPAKSPKPIQQVSISEKMKSGEPTNNYTVIGESANPSTPIHKFSAPTPDNGRPTDGAPVESNEPVEDRIDAWFKVFEAVCVAAGVDPENAKASFSPSDVKEITTGIVMSFKAAYGMHAKPHFRGSAKPGAGTLEQEDDIPF